MSYAGRVHNEYDVHSGSVQAVEHGPTPDKSAETRRLMPSAKCGSKTKQDLVVEPTENVSHSERHSVTRSFALRVSDSDPGTRAANTL